MDIQRSKLILYDDVSFPPGKKAIPLSVVWVPNNYLAPLGCSFTIVLQNPSGPILVSIQTLFPLLFSPMPASGAQAMKRSTTSESGRCLRNWSSGKWLCATKTRKASSGSMEESN